MQEEFLTKQELAEVLKISETSITRYINKGMPHIRVGKKVRFQLTEVLNWFKERGK